MIDLIVDSTLSQTNPIRFDYYLNKVYYALKDLNSEYSNFNNWYFQKVKTGIERADRFMLVKEHRGQLVGVSILKKTTEETKISTFRVMESFQQLGLGQEMLLQTFDLLETPMPVITVSGKRLDQFWKLLMSNGFKLYHEYQNYYVKGISEFSFNGPIEKVSTASQLYKMQVNSLLV